MTTTEIKMPSLGMTMETGTVVSWHVKPGDRVNAGDVILEVESEKSAFEIEAPSAGTIEQILVEEGVEVAVGELLAVLGEAAEGAATPPPSAPSEVRSELIASAADFDLVPLNTLRKTVARRMEQSHREAPAFYLASYVDAEGLVSARQRLGQDLQAATGHKLTMTDLVAKIVATVLVQHPGVNATWSDDGVRRWHTVGLGLAVATSHGLMVPVIKDAQAMSLAQISENRADFVKRADAHKLMPEDYEGGTFTLSNLGPYDIDFFTSILSPGQAGILSIGAMRAHPAAWEGEIAVRRGFMVGLTVDHRMCDGADGAVFLADLRKALEAADI